MAYSDQMLKVATDIAYEDLDKIIDKMPRHMRTSPSIEQIIEYAQNNGQGDLVTRVENILSNPEYANLKDDILNWKIVDVHNKNDLDGNGFYGCVIDTGSGGLLTSFRGSEPITNHQHAKQDWVDADIGLVNSISTKQQEEAVAFLEKIQNSDYIKNYDSIAFTGHSLGGNLSFHATIMSTQYSEIFSRLQQSTNFDGPGFSNEYIREHVDQIALVAEKLGSNNMKHYQWSVVGTILEPLPGVSFVTLDTNFPDGTIKKFVHYIGGKHSTDTLKFDPLTGMAARGEMTFYEFTVGKFTEFTDRIPAPIGNLLTDILSGIIIVATWDNTLFRTAVVSGAIGAGVAAFVIGIPAIALVGKVALVGVALLAATVIIGAALEVVVEALVATATLIAQEVGKFLKWSQKQIDSLIGFIQGEVAKLNQWFKQTFNAGYKYATANPVVKLETYKLRVYADRLRNVNARLNRLDSRLNFLYWQVGFLDLLTLMRADLMTGESWRIKKCINYLEDTANDFEAVEKRIMSQL
ncbi:Mbeg1-like protein [Sutcliffiella cohnii]|uniref:Mbeg1-like protein n=2 Tax=Sutcliffiella TaxID=2837511 RepID=UPI002E1A6A6E|nr:DUF2974 domain-containing protein [Sutcliffiella cohnii]